MTQLINLARGTSMRVSIDCETFDLPGYAVDDTSQYTGKEGVNFVDCACAYDKENGKLNIFAINKNDKDEYPLSIDLKGFGNIVLDSHSEIACEDTGKVTTPDEDDFFAPVKVSEAKIVDGVVKTHIKPLSWNVLEISVKDQSR